MKEEHKLLEEMKEVINICAEEKDIMNNFMPKTLESWLKRTKF